MSFFDLFRRPKPRALPTPFETLAAFTRFQNVRECSPDFYAEHHNAIDMTVGFIGFLGQQHDFFARVYKPSMAPLPAIAATLESGMRQINLDQRTLDFIDSTMTTIMETLLPVVKAKDCPAYLKECEWPIVGGFEA